MSYPSEFSPEHPRPYRTGLKIATAIVGSSLVTAIAMFIAFLRIEGFFAPPPPLVASVRWGSVSEMDARLDLAVRERFAIGSRENELIRELAAQGFKPDWTAGNATYRDQGFVCANEYSVRWGVDADDRLTRVSGEFRAICL